MKRQELFEDILRSKLDGAEVEPPAFVFDKIEEAMGNKTAVRVLPWYKTMASQRVAAAVAMLLVAGAVYWVNFGEVNSNQQQLAVQFNDSIRQLQLQHQLQALELAANDVQEVSENKKSESMQPVVNSARLEVVQFAAATELTETRTMIKIETIPSKNAQPITVTKNSASLLAAAFDQTYTRVEKPTSSNSNNNSAIVNTFTKLSSGEYFDLAKQKVNDFVSKEHYVNFAIGNVEFGQTIQLSK